MNLNLIQLLYLMQKDDEKISFVEYEKLRKYCVGLLDINSKNRSIEMIEYLLSFKEYRDFYTNIIFSSERRTANLKILKDFIRKFSKPFRKAIKSKKLK